ncbi:unnamed protein product [Ilex paraguariensis]|uniref:Uncharacterized protein n=1 Tax=Ilex paraguariensis TaxID=185542 RepID=A0ABC8SVJ7_9AQUA
MESSLFETQKPSQTPLPFPPHRRRHLRSETYRTIVHILSNCCDESQRSHALPTVPEEPKQDCGGSALGQLTEINRLVGPNHMESESWIVLKKSEENGEVIGSEDRDCRHKVIRVDGLDHVNAMVHDINVNSVGEGSQTTNGGVGLRLINNQEDYLNDPEPHMEESGHKEQLQVDQELSIGEACETIDSCFGIDMIAGIAGTTKPGEINEETRSNVERYFSEEVELELHQKEMELEKLITCSKGRPMDSSLCVTADEEMEEGQISGDDGVYDESMDFSHEDVVSLEKKKVEQVKFLKAIVDEVVSTHDEQNAGLERDSESSSLFVKAVDNAGNSMDVELRERIRKEVGNESLVVVCGKIIEAQKAHKYESMLETGEIRKQCGGVESGSPAACVTNLALHGKISGENDTEIEGPGSTEKDEGVNNKKKKRILTKERKTKKKKKERIKRAEKNRKLGVKRLKLQPILKPKTVAYCRHFLKGRCHEVVGFSSPVVVDEKCKFSHDTIPLTKSKMPVEEGSVIASNVSNPESSSSSLLSNIGPKKPLSIHGAPHRSVNAKPYCTGIPPGKSTEPKVTQPTLKSTAEAPKGISFFSQGKLSVGNTSNKQKQAASSLRVDDGVKVGDQIIHSVAGVAQKLNEITKKTPAMLPKGINFLSFGKAPSDYSFSIKPSSLPVSGDYGTGKSLLGNASEGKQASSSPMSDDGANVDHRAGQSISNIVNSNQMTNQTPSAVVPRGINFLSYGKAPQDVSSNKKQQSLLSTQGSNSVPSSVQGKERRVDKPQISNAMSWTLPSSSFSCGQSLQQLANGDSKSTPSSSQKSLLSNSPISVQKSLQSMLAFAAKFESGIKIDPSTGDPAVRAECDNGAESSQN